MAFHTEGAAPLDEDAVSARLAALRQGRVGRSAQGCLAASSIAPDAHIAVGLGQEKPLPEAIDGTNGPGIPEDSCDASASEQFDTHAWDLAELWQTAQTDPGSAITELKLRFQCLWLRGAAMLHRPGVRGGIGALVLLYGGHFKTAVVVYRSLETVRMPSLQAKCGEIAEEFQGAAQEVIIGMQEQIVAAAPAASAGVSAEEVSVAGESLANLDAPIQVDHRPLLAVFARLQSSGVAHVAAALNGNTARLGLALWLSQRLAEVAGPRIEVFLLVAGRKLELLPTREAELSEAQRVLIRVVVDAVCTTFGLGITWALRGWSALWTTCSLGGQLCADDIADHFGKDAIGGQTVVLATSLAAAGFAYQAQYWGRPPILLPLWPLLVPARCIEQLLLSVA